MRNRNGEKSPRAASRATSNVQRAARSEPAPRDARKRSPRSGVRARSTQAGKAKVGSVAPITKRRDSEAVAPAAPLAEVSHAAAPLAQVSNQPSVYQGLYVAACSADEGGRLSLDVERFARALAETHIGVFAEQRLYHLAVLAAAEGQAALAVEDVTAALSADPS